MCLNYETLALHRYVPNQDGPGFEMVEEWTVKNREQFFASTTPQTIEKLRQEG